MSERKAFKEYFDRGAAEALAAQCAPHIPGFDSNRFLSRAIVNLDDFEMKARVAQFCDALRRELPAGEAHRARRLQLLQGTLPEKLPNADDVTNGFLQWPISAAIAEEAEGCSLEELDAAMEAMLELTQRFTSEFAVRPYVRNRPEELARRMLALASHPSEHVRRWASEGLRPRLPWGEVLHAYVEDPTPILPVLEALKDDPSLYVRRSVANTLNDIAKDHPELVIKRCGAWTPGASKERSWLIRHALRSLVKAGHPEALGVLGFRDRPEVKASVALRGPDKDAPRTLRLGERLELDFLIQNEGDEAAPVILDYIVHYVKARGDTSPKTFKGKTFTLKAQESHRLKKTLVMAHRSIRRLYPGEHRVEIQLNGKSRGEGSFELQF